MRGGQAPFAFPITLDDGDVSDSFLRVLRLFSVPPCLRGGFYSPSSSAPSFPPCFKDFLRVSAVKSPSALICEICGEKVFLLIA